MLLPESAQDLDLGKLSEALRRVRSLDVCQKPLAIGAYRLEVFFPRFLALGQPLVLDTPSITLEPLRIGVFSEPLRIRARQSVQGGPHRLRSSLPFAQDAQSAQYMSRVGARSASHLEVAALLTPLKQLLQK